MTLSVMRPSTTVVATVINAYTAAPDTAIANGSGCVRMYEPMTRRPRLKTLRRSLNGLVPPRLALDGFGRCRDNVWDVRKESPEGLARRRPTHYTRFSPPMLVLP